MNRREFIGAAAKAVAVVAAGAATLDLVAQPARNRPAAVDYEAVLSPEIITAYRGMEARAEMIGDWTAEDHLNHLAGFLLDNPDTRAMFRRHRLAK